MTHLAPKIMMAMLLMTGIVLLPVFSYVVVYLAIVSAMIGFLITLPTSFDQIKNNMFLPVWIGFALLAIAAVTPDKVPADFMVFIYLAPLILMPFVYAFAISLDFRELITIIGIACVLAVSIAAIESVVESVVLDSGRAGSGNNPIHFASIAVVLGCFAPIGLFGTTSTWRAVFLSGPVLGVSVTLLSGSKGPLLAGLIMSAVTLVFVVMWFPSLRRLIVAALVLGSAFLAGLAILGNTSYTRAVDLFGDVIDLAQGQSDLPSSVSERILFYESAFAAFVDKPWTGLGFSRLSEVPALYLQTPKAAELNYEHLHSDLLDFIASSGILGLLSYAAFVFSPLLLVFYARDEQSRRIAMFGGVLIAVGYVVLGLSNAVLGVLPQTMLFALLTGLIASFVAPKTAER